MERQGRTVPEILEVWRGALLEQMGWGVWTPHPAKLFLGGKKGENITGLVWKGRC